jgi:nicotinamidase/pyrazinamidase
MKALVLVDIQNDFCPGGALAVAEGDQVVSVANKLMEVAPLTVATQDYHPPAHKSFASNHGKNVFDVINLNGLSQVLWPAHCVQGTLGAEFHPQLAYQKNVFAKGVDVEVDSYSGFFDNGKKNKTALDDFLKLNGVKEVFVMGLATDYCVKFTAVDAVELGYKVHLVIDGCRGVNLTPGDVDKAVAEMKKKRINVVTSEEALKLLTA